MMCIATNAFAQNSFPTSNAIWYESIRGDYRIFGLLGDTIFNDAVYSKLYLFSDTILSYENVSINSYNNGYIGAIRNEGQKVFFKPATWEHPDILLYDFGAEAGDTVWHNASMPYPAIYDHQNYYYDFGFCPDYYIAKDCYSIINAITTDENNRKIYDVTANSWSYMHKWYEGIGSNKGILFSMSANMPVNWSQQGFQLNCFKHNDIVKYVNNDGCNKCFCRQTYHNIENVNIEKINIFPNPTNDILIIQSTAGALTFNILS